MTILQQGAVRGFSLFAVALLILPGCQSADVELSGPPPVTGPMEQWAADQLTREAEADQRVFDKLLKTLPELDPTARPPYLRAQETQAENALRWLAILSDLPIDVNWEVLNREALEVYLAGWTAPVKPLPLGGRSVDAALRLLLDAIAGGPDVLDYAVHAGRALVSTRDDLNTHMMVRVYHVGDLLGAGHAYRDWLSRRERAAWPKIVDLDPWRPDPESDGRRRNRLEDQFAGFWRNQEVDNLTSTLRTFVTPDSWAPTGDAHLLVRGDTLIVKQSFNGHLDLATLLMQLRSIVASADPPPPDRPRPVVSALERFAAARLELARAADAEVRARLASRIAEIRFREIHLDNAATFLAQLCEVPIVVHWAALEQLGITPGREIRLEMRDVPLDVALPALLAHAAGGFGRLDFEVHAGAIHVSTMEQLAARKRIEIYNVRDFYWPMLRRERRRMAERFGGKLPAEVVLPPRELDEPTGQSKGALFGNDDDDSSAGDEDEWWANYRPISSIEHSDGLLNAIRSNVLPDTWVPMGDAHIALHTDLLIVRQSDRGHRQLARLLVQMRKADADAEAAETGP